MTAVRMEGTSTPTAGSCLASSSRAALSSKPAAPATRSCCCWPLAARATRVRMRSLWIRMSWSRWLAGARRSAAAAWCSGTWGRRRSLPPWCCAVGAGAGAGGLGGSSGRRIGRAVGTAVVCLVGRIARFALVRGDLGMFDSVVNGWIRILVVVSR